MQAKSRLKRDIVPIREWLDSEYYLGPECHAVLPFWKEHLIRFFESGDNLFIFHGSYSIGKTYISVIALLRMIYEISCIENFPCMFGLSPSTKISFAFISMSVSKAQSTGIDKLLRIFDAIPYFQDIEPRNMDRMSSLDMGYLEVIHASNAGHLTGGDLFGVIFDEANFVKAKKGEEYDKAKLIFLEAQIRGKTRFSIEGQQYGFFGLLSSSQFETSFTEQQIKEARETNSGYVVEAAVYDLRPAAYSKERFTVFTGLDEIRPFIVDEVTEDQKLFIAKTYGQTFDQFMETNKALTTTVPVDLRKFYHTDIEYSLNTLSGLTVHGSTRFLKNTAILERAYTGHNLVAPTMVEVPTLSLMSDDIFSDFIDEKKLLANYEEGQRVYFHLDLSLKNDRTGFGAVYKSSASGKFRSLLYVSIFKKVTAEEIDLSKVLDIIFYMRDLGMNIGFVSYDQYASKYISQEFKKRIGANKTDEISMDRDDSAYMLYLFLLKKGLVEQYRYAPFDKNVRLLVHDHASMTVDHPDGAEKDICDALVGALSNAFRIEGITREELIVNQMLQSSSGFYEESPEDFYSDLVAKSGADAESDGFYASIMKNC